MSAEGRSVLTISSAFISSFFGRKMSSDLQDIVRCVVENLSNIQPANSSATSSSEGCQNSTNTTEVQELNRCFQVPRLPATNSSVLQQSSGRDLAAGFSSRQNYSSVRQPRKRRQVPRSSSGRFQPYVRSRGGNRDVVESPSYRQGCLSSSQPFLGESTSFSASIGGSYLKEGDFFEGDE